MNTEDSQSGPLQRIVRRLRELADAVTQGRDAVAREFTMRVPAEPERDADLVLSAAAAEIERLCDALARIERWELPQTGEYWDAPKNTRPMSYGACYGSNGERDYFRAVARDALTQPPNAALTGCPPGQSVERNDSGQSG